jgi:glycosyltransferase involved in cell wall biosynthesis
MSSRFCIGATKIGLDAVPLTQLPCGIGYYIFYLLEALIPLHPDTPFFFYTFSEHPLLEAFRRHPNVIIRPLPPRLGSHALWGQTQLPRALRQDGIDLFWGTTQTIPILAPKTCKTVLLMHDFVYKLYPRSVSTLKGALLSLLAPLMVRRADAIVCNSKGTQEKLAYFYGRNADLVLTPPVKTAYQPPGYHLAALGLTHKGYFLSVGTLEPRKNWLGFIEAFLRVQTPFPLVIVGSGGWKNKNIVRQLRAFEAQFPERLRCLGHVDDATLASLFSSARYTLCFSLYEGYGMPIAESRSCRTPVICLDQVEMREAAEEDACFVSSLDDPAFARALLSDPQTPAACTYPTNREKAIALSKLI